MTSCMAKFKRQVKFAAMQYTPDLWVGTMGAKVTLDNAGSKTLQLPMTNGWLLLIGRHYSE